MNSLLNIFFFLLAVNASAQAAQKTEITWFGHAAFRVQTPSGKSLWIDPWITNPANKSGKEDLAQITQADLILITHGHNDHVGDSAEIAKKTGAQLVSTFDLGRSLAAYAGFPKNQVTLETQGNFGGELTLLKGEVKIAFIPAIHSSAVPYTRGQTEEPQAGGNPGGFLISIQNGPTIYHTGDTDLFSDMSLISHFHKVDLMLTCIGGHFTMNPSRAAEAIALVKPTQVVPMHYGTFPIINGTPDELQKELKKNHVKTKLKVLAVKETLQL